MKQHVPLESNEDSFIRQRNARHRKHLAKEEARADELSRLLDEEEENDRNFTEWICEVRTHFEKKIVQMVFVIDYSLLQTLYTVIHRWYPRFCSNLHHHNVSNLLNLAIQYIKSTI